MPKFFIMLAVCALLVASPVGAKATEGIRPELREMSELLAIMGQYAKDMEQAAKDMCAASASAKAGIFQEAQQTFTGALMTLEKFGGAIQATQNLPQNDERAIQILGMLDIARNYQDRLKMAEENLIDCRMK